MRVDDYFAGFDAVFAVDRDVNILAVGESRLSWPEYSHLTVVKVGMGVGCAFVLDGHVYRGARGGAGQLSAPRASHEPLHRLELEASGATIRSALRDAGHDVATSADIVAAARAHDPLVLEQLHAVGTRIGEALADVVGLLNPQAVIVGGNLAETGERLVAGIRSALLTGTHDFSRRGLVVERARLGDKAGVRGASLMAQDELFDVARVSAATSRRAPGA